MESTEASAFSQAGFGGNVLATLRRGTAIPAHPLALDKNRELDERRQRALSRYYLASGAGGLAVGVHTTQFQIHDPDIGLLKPVWALAAEEMDRCDVDRTRPLIRVAGLCGDTKQAVGEATMARDMGYHLGLLNLNAMAGKSIEHLVAHCRSVADTIDIFGFYLQPAAGGVPLPLSFWRKFCEIENVRAIKIAPFNRYQTIDVVRAVVECGRDDIALYTGNDDNIVLDLLTPFRFVQNGQPVERRIVGGLLGHWSVWTSKAVELLEQCHEVVNSHNTANRNGRSEEGCDIPLDMLRLNLAVTDCNAVLFDAANGFSGCIPGIHEVLRRQGLLEGIGCLDANEVLSPGQASELDRIEAAYPDLVDNDFVAEHRDDWLRA